MIVRGFLNLSVIVCASCSPFSNLVMCIDVCNSSVTRKNLLFVYSTICIVVFNVCSSEIMELKVDIST